MPRGRPRSFDENEVLDTLIKMFVRDGFEGVSISAVCKETGVSLQSLYSTFGDKAELYRRALTRYGETASDPLIQGLRNTTDPIEALRNFVKSFEYFNTLPEGQGCLFTQSLASAVEGGPCDGAIARGYANRIRKALRERAREASESRKLTGDPDLIADSLLSASYGAAVVGRGGLPKSVITNSVKEALNLLER